MILNIHAGHNPDGKTACGAIGLIKESTEARAVVKEVISLLESKGHKVYDCTENNGTSSGDVLRKIVAKCNQRKVDLDISIHFNAGANDRNGNKRTTGCECLVYSTSSKSAGKAKDIVDSIGKLGLANRGVKVRPDLYYLKSTQNPSVLIECCFVDDRDDINLYNPKSMAKAIVEGILGTQIQDGANQDPNKGEESSVKVEKRDIKIDGKVYQLDAIVKDGTTFVKLRDFEQAGYTIGYSNGVASIDKP